MIIDYIIETVCFKKKSFRHGRVKHRDQWARSWSRLFKKTGKCLDEKIIATRPSYPAGPAKVPSLIDCTFTSGIVMHEDGKADLYGGLGDTMEGRIIIDNPFEGFGKIMGW